MIKPPTSDDAAPGHLGLSVRELAEETGVSVRTIRYYQAEGLLDAPNRRGRTTLYDDAHRLRLRAITRLQERGLRLAAIREILRDGEAVDEAVVAGWTGLSEVLARPWTDDRPALLDEEELAERLGGLPEETGAGLVRVGLVERRSDTGRVVYLVPSPGLLQLAIDGLRLGIPLEAGGRIQAFLRDQVRAIATELVERFTDEVSLGHLSEHGPADLAQLLERARPLTRSTIDLLFAHEMERATRALLDDVDGPVGGPPEGTPT